MSGQMNDGVKNRDGAKILGQTREEHASGAKAQPSIAVSSGTTDAPPHRLGPVDGDPGEAAERRRR
jgi:hypothetical protein